MKKISKRYYFLIGSLIFGMFFGAGNLISRFIWANWPVQTGEKQQSASFFRVFCFPCFRFWQSASRVQTAFMILQNLSVQNMH